MHLNVATQDMNASVAFYATLLNSQPAKRHDDYALFIVDDPALELALDLTGTVEPADDVHYGIFVESERDVEKAFERLNGAGLASTLERNGTCCYANQTKFWTSDPEGRRWEIYTVHRETLERDEARACCA